MEWSWIWKGILVVLMGTFLLRVAGRKTISQMTLAETVIMVSIGTLLVQPIATKSIWIAFGTGLVLVLTLLVIEYAQIKMDGVKKVITGKAKVIIEKGELIEKNMLKLRITADQVEMRLRQKNVKNINDVEWATLEPNGQVGFILKEEAQPVTKKEFQQLQQLMVSSTEEQMKLLHQQLTQLQTQLNQNNLFTEVAYGEHTTPPPKHLQ